MLRRNAHLGYSDTPSMSETEAELFEDLLDTLVHESPPRVDALDRILEYRRRKAAENPHSYVHCQVCGHLLEEDELIPTVDPETGPNGPAVCSQTCQSRFIASVYNPLAVRNLTNTLMVRAELHLDRAVSTEVLQVKILQISPGVIRQDREHLDTDYRDITSWVRYLCTRLPLDEKTLQMTAGLRYLKLIVCLVKAPSNSTAILMVERILKPDQNMHMLLCPCCQGHGFMPSTNPAHGDVGDDAYNPFACLEGEICSCCGGRGSFYVEHETTRIDNTLSNVLGSYGYTIYAGEMLDGASSLDHTGVETGAYESEPNLILDPLVLTFGYLSDMTPETRAFTINRTLKGRPHELQIFG